MPVFALLVISKAGSLIYHRTLPTSTSASTSSSGSQPATGTLGLPGTTSLTTNDYLVLAGTFHGVHAITKNVTPKFLANSASSSDHPPAPTTNGVTGKASSFRYPIPDAPVTGIESLESSFFKLTVFQSLTGTKFLLFTDPSMPNTDGLIRGIYDRFADHVCKNPFWHIDNPIRLDGWERALNQFLFRSRYLSHAR
ncbi:hypothetical protein LTR70_006417 [Exophiala xenobiotica]|nr:hypothetical protein LTR70_006417 [Exophiala xenobiotica]